MACDVVGSPFSDHAFDTTEWDAAYDSHLDGSAIDPRMLSNPPSPASSHGGPLDTSRPNQIFAPDITFDTYPDFSTQAAATPYFTPNGGSLQPSPLRHPFRRSISEPPGDFAHHHQVQPTFTRSGYPPGFNISKLQADSRSHALKGSSRSKAAARQHPYQHGRQNGKSDQSQRYQLRRTNTQPMRPPTSTPMSVASPMMPPPPSPLPHPMMYEPMPMTQQPRMQYVSSRVCTPGPEQGMAIDPMLNASVRAPTISIPLTVDELRAMIMDAVQNAVKGLQAKEEVAPAVESHQVLQGTERSGEATGEDVKMEEPRVDAARATGSEMHEDIFGSIERDIDA